MSFWSWIGLADKKRVGELQLSINSLIEENQLLREDNTKLLNCFAEAKDNYLEEILQKIEASNSSISEAIQIINSGIKNITESIRIVQKEVGELKSLQSSQYEALIEKIISFQQNVINLNERIRNQIKLGYDNIKGDSEEKKKIILERLQANNDVTLDNSERLSAEIRKYDTELGDILRKINEQNEEVYENVCSINEVLNNNSIKIEKIEDVSINMKNKTDSITEIQSKLVALADSVQNLWTIMKAIWVDSVLSDLDSIK